MKQFARIFLVVVAFAGSVWAGQFDGSYSFASRVKEGAPDMAGWTGQMQIHNNTANRNYKSPDGASTKFYNATLTPAGNLFVFKTTAAYKPEYVGNEFKNKITLSGNTLTLESEDGKFKELWTKR